MIDKNLVLIEYLQSIIPDYIFKSEYSTKETEKVIVVQEQSGEKQLLWCGKTLYNYYEIMIFGRSIREQKLTSVIIGDLIGKHVQVNYNNETYQIIFMQYTNPQTIAYEDIRRVGYSAILKCLINKIGG